MRLDPVAGGEFGRIRLVQLGAVGLHHCYQKFGQGHLHHGAHTLLPFTRRNRNPARLLRSLTSHSAFNLVRR